MLLIQSRLKRLNWLQLSPALRSQVEARLVSGQTVHGVLEAMLLNNVSQEFASGHVVATDFQRSDIVVENKSGQLKVFPFDVATLTCQELADRRPKLRYVSAGDLVSLLKRRKGSSDGSPNAYDTVADGCRDRADLRGGSHCPLRHRR